MRSVRSAILGAFLVASALAADDPFAGPVPSAADLMMTLDRSKRDYTILLAGKPWEGADGPERVEAPLAPQEKDALASCRALLAKGDLDAAQKAADDLVAKSPAAWEAHHVRASVLHARKADADAAAALRTSLIGNRRNPEAWKVLDGVAKALGKKVVRPRIALRGWVRDAGKGAIELGHVPDDPDGMPWNHYATARAVYRYEGPFARDFPAAKSHVFTFREQMFAMNVLADAAQGEKEDGTKLSADLRRVLAERAAGTLAPFAFFAAFPEPVPAAPEPGFDVLRPRLEKYFDEKILVRR